MLPDLAVLNKAGLDALINTLVSDGYTVIGPALQDGAIRLVDISSANDLPRGWVDHQEGGSYRLEPTDSDAYFSVVHGPDSAKQHLFPPTETVFTVESGSPDRFVPADHSQQRSAFIGLRPCDVAAVAVQDRVFLSGPYVDPAYAARRDTSLVIAVNCTRSVSSCFCTSMGSGPRAENGFDLALTEILEPTHQFLVEVGSEAGANLLDRLPTTAPSTDIEKAAEAAVGACATSMAKHLDTNGIKELLYANLDHPRWDKVAERCLTCGNCTLACPTCFCSTPVDTSSLDGATAERSRVWASCFSLDYSYMGGHPVRLRGASRYRQWMTHKLATWIDQFGSSGCVGCGRCITWCPVGIDLTEETKAIQAADVRSSA